MSNRTRRAFAVLAAAAVAVAAAGALPSIAASKPKPKPKPKAVVKPKPKPIPSTFTLTSPAEGPVRGVVPVRWNWTGGSSMRTKWVGVVTARAGDAPFLSAPALPMWHGKFLWDTTQYADGSYSLRGFVVSTSLASSRGNVIVDNTPPVVDIVHPRPGAVVVDDRILAAGAPQTLVAGRVTLTAEATDATSGVASISWFVDGEWIGDGAEVEHDFGLDPVRHTVTVRATDAAGNQSEVSRDVGHEPPSPDADTRSAPVAPPQDEGESGPGAPDLSSTLPVTVPDETPARLPE